MPDASPCARDIGMKQKREMSLSYEGNIILHAI